MNKFILKVTAHHGEPKLVDKLYVREDISVDTPIPIAGVVNDLTSVEVSDLALAENGYVSKSHYTLDQLIDDFQDEYGCKVAWGDEINPVQQDNTVVHEFDIFEPNWSEELEAEDAAEDLSERLIDWINGYPTGR